MINDRDAQSPRMSQAIGRYQLLKRIGRGGMGDVWLGEDPLLRRRVALKLLPPHNQQDQEFALRFEREARAAAALVHPHIFTNTRLRGPVASRWTRHNVYCDALHQRWSAGRSSG